MAKTVFKKKDRNRYRKVYPYIRKAPSYVLCSDKEAEIEIGSVSFTNSSVGSFTFKSSFKTVPVITAISYDSDNNGTADINVYIDSITTSAVIFKTSAVFTGKVQFHAIRIAS
jgi:hypothetical protein